MQSYTGERSAQSRLEQARYQYEYLLLNAGSKMLETPSKSPSQQPQSHEKSENYGKHDIMHEQSGIYGGNHGNAFQSLFLMDCNCLYV